MSTTIAATPATTTDMWAVIDGQDRVVVLFGGTGAEAEARHWQERGYRIAPLADD